jgi:hypothetical protein
MFDAKGRRGFVRTPPAKAHGNRDRFLLHVFLGRVLINLDGQVGGCSMSVLPPKADIRSAKWHVRFGPIPNSCTATKRKTAFGGGLSELQLGVLIRRLLEPSVIRTDLH